MKFLIILFVLSSFTASSQEEKTPFGISFAGFVRSDIVFDSRQTDALREGGILLFPKPVQNDINQKDINAQSTLGMFVLHTRLAGNISGPKAFGATSSAYMEAEFFGVSEEFRFHVRG